MKVHYADRTVEDVTPITDEGEIVDTSGKLYLIGASFGFSGDWYLIRASDLADAIDVLVDSEHGKGLRIDDADIGDYDEDAYSVYITDDVDPTTTIEKRADSHEAAFAACRFDEADYPDMAGEEVRVEIEDENGQVKRFTAIVE